MQQDRMRVVAEAIADERIDGVDAISIVEIMARAGMTHGGFYNYSSSKEAMLMKFVRPRSKNRRSRGAKVSRPSTSGKQGGYKRLVMYYLGLTAQRERCPMVSFLQGAWSGRARNASRLRVQ